MSILSRELYALLLVSIIPDAGDVIMSDNIRNGAADEKF